MLDLFSAKITNKYLSSKKNRVKINFYHQKSPFHTPIHWFLQFLIKNYPFSIANCQFICTFAPLWRDS
jgi:hypothetical protein